MSESKYMLVGPSESQSVPIVKVPQEGARDSDKRKPLTKEQIVACLVEAGCLGMVKMSYDSGPYEITRASINAGRFARAIERAHGIGVDAALGAAHE